jgi:crotonobetaine/carnitine-CoA ligase
LNPAYKGNILEHTLNVAGAEILVAHSELVHRLSGLNLKHLKKIILVGHEAEELPADYETIQWAEIPRIGARRPKLEQPREPWHDMALIYTSGTTGQSKGVRCSYLHHYTYADGNIAPEVGAEDRFFVCVSMFHSSGTTETYTMLRRGGSVAITPGFRTQTFWEEVRKYGVTTAYLMSAMANFLYKQPPQHDDADNPLRFAAMHPIIKEVKSFRKRFGVNVWSSYGMTEIPAVVRTELNPKVPNSCGKLWDRDNYEARVVDENDVELPPGKVGELIVRHSRPWSLTSGDKGIPEATAEAWQNGWFHTGDALFRNEEGNFFFADRVKDAIRRCGENISSIEVEREILAHPAVEQAAVVAVKSELEEDEVKACVKVRPGESISPEELIQFLIPRLPYFMVPRYFEFMEELPKSASFKIQKYVLREAGVTPKTWDREAAGIQLKREKLG